MEEEGGASLRERKDAWLGVGWIRLASGDRERQMRARRAAARRATRAEAAPKTVAEESEGVREGAAEGCSTSARRMWREASVGKP